MSITSATSMVGKKRNSASITVCFVVGPRRIRFAQANGPGGETHFSFSGKYLGESEET
jgi:hypothetical protein